MPLNPSFLFKLYTVFFVVNRELFKSPAELIDDIAFKIRFLPIGNCRLYNQVFDRILLTLLILSRVLGGLRFGWAVASSG